MTHVDKAKMMHHMTHPFDKAKVNQLIGLEDKIMERKFDLVLLDKLCSYYSELVEFYDVMRDPLKYYFLEKIQMTASKKTNLLIQSSKPQPPKPKRIGSSERNLANIIGAAHGKYSRFNTEKINNLNNSDVNDRLGNSMNRYSRKKPVPILGDGQLRRKKRAKKYKIDTELDNMKQTFERKTSHMMAEKLASSNKNDDLIKNQLKQQSNSIKERLRQRSLASFNRSKEMSKNSFHIFGRKKKEKTSEGKPIPAVGRRNAMGIKSGNILKDLNQQMDDRASDLGVKRHLNGRVGFGGA